MINNMKKIMIGLVLTGSLMQPSYGVSSMMNHVLDGVATAGVAAASAFGGWKWLGNSQQNVEQQKDVLRKQKEELERNYFGDDEDTRKISEIDRQISALDIQEKSDDTRAKFKIGLACGAFAATCAYFISTLKSPMSKAISACVPSQKLLASRVLHAGSFGVAAAGGVFTATHLFPNYFAQNKMGLGICGVLAFAAVTIGMKIMSNKIKNTAVREHVINVVKNWSAVSQEHNFDKTLFSGLSQKLVRGEQLTEEEYVATHKKLKELGFNDEMTGVICA